MGLPTSSCRMIGRAATLGACNTIGEGLLNQGHSLSELKALPLKHGWQRYFVNFCHVLPNPGTVRSSDRSVAAVAARHHCLDSFRGTASVVTASYPTSHAVTSLGR